MKTHAYSFLIGLTLMGCSSKFNDNDGKLSGNAADTGTEGADEGSDDDDDDDDGDDDDDDPATADEDGDGVTIEDGDCDDEDDTVYEGAEEICDGIDNDCDDHIDEGFDSIMYTLYRDADGDGYGDPDVSEDVCPDMDTDGWVEDNTDCDDERADVYPGADEDFDDETDNDCDGAVDERFDYTDVDIEDLDDDVRYGTPSSLAVDSTNAAHIVFEVDGDVMYTKITATGVGTDPEVISEDDGALWRSGTYIDAEVDGLDQVHVGYVSAFEYTSTDGEVYDRNELHYASGGAGLGWSDMVIDGDDSNFDQGRYVDVEVHDSDFFGFTATTATFAYYDGDNGNPKVADIFVEDGDPIITPIGSGLPPELLGDILTLPPSAMYTSLGITSDATHYVAWYDPNAVLTTDPQIQYSRYTWDPSDVIDESWSFNLGALLPGNIDIEDTLMRTTAEGLRLEVTHPVAASAPEEGEEAPASTSEEPCVTYTSNDTLKFGCDGPTGWGGMETIPLEGYIIPQEPDLAINQNNEFFISFYNAPGRDLMLASKRKDSDWEVITVDEVGDVGQASAIDVGADGSIHISYYDATNGRLKYARGF